MAQKFIRARPRVRYPTGNIAHPNLDVWLSMVLGSVYLA